MSILSIKETFEEIPTKANSALNSQVAYYKLFLFRFIAKSSYGLITFFVVAFASLLVLFVGIFYILVAVVALVLRKRLIEKPLLEKLSEIYFKAEPDDEE